MKKVLITLLTAGVFMTAATSVLAAGSSYGVGASNCQIIYGGGQICQKQVKFTIEKQVLKPTKGGGYVDNLSANDATFAPGQDVTYKIIVKNTGDNTIDKLDVADTFPQFLTFVSGPGNYDKNSRILSFSITNMPAGKELDYTIMAKAVDDSSLPQDQTMICPVNTVKAVEINGNTATSSTQICVQRSVPTNLTPKVFQTPPMKQTPSTGPEVLGLIALIPTGAAGMLLRKKSK